MPARLRDAVVWIALLSVPLLVNLGARELTEIDESRAGVLVRDMAEGGRWLLPRTPDGHVIEKPVAYYGAAAVLSRLVGLSEWSLRLVSVAAAVGTLACVWYLALLYGGSAAARIATAVLAGNVLFLDWARAAMVDMTLAFFIAAGMTAWLHVREGKLPPWRGATAAGIAFGLAVLSKGPIGLALPAVALLADEIVQTRGVPREMPWRAWMVVAGVAAAVALAWYLPAAAEGGAEFLQTSVLSENLYMPLGQARGLGVSHHKPLTFYPSRQLVLLGAAWLAVPALLAWIARRGVVPGRRALASWFATGFVLFLIALNKRHYYLLPLQAPLAVMAGLAVASAARRSRWWTALAAGAMGTAAAAAVVVAMRPDLLHSVRADLADAAASHRWNLAGWALAAGVAAALMLRAKEAPVTFAACALALILAKAAVVDPVTARFGMARAFVRRSLMALPGGVDPAVVAPGRGYALEYYWPRRLRRVESPDGDWVFIRRARLPAAWVEVVEWPDDDDGRVMVLARRR